MQCRCIISRMESGVYSRTHVSRACEVLPPLSLTGVYKPQRLWEYQIHAGGDKKELTTRPKSGARPNPIFINIEISFANQNRL